MPINLKNKRVLVFGLGLLDGGVATATWLLEQGARVTVTHPKDSKVLAPFIRRIEERLKKTASDGEAYEKIRARLTVALGKPSVGPDLMIKTPADEVALFCRAWPKKIIGISGTCGKTTTATWATHLIKNAVLAAHAPDRSLMAAMKSRARIAVVVDGPVSSVRTDKTYADYPGNIVPADFVARWGKHNLSNIRAAMYAARLAGVSWADTGKRMATLPQVPCRQEIVHRDRKITIVNDAMATSPEGGIAALERWGGDNCILITGGTDLPAGRQAAQLDYRTWGAAVPEHLRKTNIFFLDGSATLKMRTALGSWGSGIRSYGTLKAAWRAALARAGKFVAAVLLFSPAAKSVELFANEFDRGQQFNALVKRGLK